MELIKRAARALKERRSELGWSAASGAIGAGVGLLFATLYLWAR